MVAEKPWTTSCVAEGTRIATPEGLSLVEDLKVGDTVWSVDPLGVSSEAMVAARVTMITRARREGFVRLTAGEHALNVTPEHPVWSEGRRAYVPAGQWQATDRVLLPLQPQPVRTPARVSVHGPSTWVYDLTVDSVHHNFVADGFLVHNKSPPCSSGSTTTCEFPPGSERLFTMMHPLPYHCGEVPTCPDCGYDTRDEPWCNGSDPDNAPERLDVGDGGLFVAPHDLGDGDTDDTESGESAGAR